MYRRWIILTLTALGALAGCQSDPDRDWMKVNQGYTVEEFRRDLKECSPRGKLDDACMRNRGWVDVRRTPEKQPDLSDNPYRR